METSWREFEYDHFSLGNDCHRFGQWNGCRSDCPQLIRGECDADDYLLFESLLDECLEDSEIIEILTNNKMW